MSLCFKKDKFSKTHTNVWSRGGLQKKRFSITCVLQNVKKLSFLGPFLANLVDVQKTL